jgi:hypothetical protein
MSYEAFQSLAFTQYGIPNQILETVRPWVEKECQYSFNNKADSLGYAELADIQSVPQAMEQLKQLIWMATTMETPKKTTKAREQYLKDAGGRVGKGFYRYALKAYYLTLEINE